MDWASPCRRRRRADLTLFVELSFSCSSVKVRRTESMLSRHADGTDVKVLSETRS